MAECLRYNSGMEILRFVFSFLYTRNWYTGQMELSRPRVFLFCGLLGLIILSVIIVGLLQVPIVYSQPSMTSL